MTHDACPTCAGMKLATRLVCSACWTRVPFELKHERAHAIAFGPAHIHASDAKIIAHLQDRLGRAKAPADPTNQLALL